MRQQFWRQRHQKCSSDADGGSLTEPIYATSTSFGYYQFSEVPTGKTYIITVKSRRYAFNPSSMVINLTDSLDDVDFVGEEQLIQYLQFW